MSKASDLLEQIRPVVSIFHKNTFPLCNNEDIVQSVSISAGPFLEVRFTPTCAGRHGCCGYIPEHFLDLPENELSRVYQNEQQREYQPTLGLG